jgi:hypothetical protein
MTTILQKGNIYIYIIFCGEKVVTKIPFLWNYRSTGTGRLYIVPNFKGLYFHAQ